MATPPRPMRPKSSSPAERGEEHAAHQRQLKAEAAARRFIEKVLQVEVGTRYPRCVAGKRACPPEDCGGVWGYADFLKAINDPGHESHEEMLEWIGGSFDPEKFDIAEVNATPRTIRTAIYVHAVAVEASLARAQDAEDDREQAECLKRAERRAAAALAWAELLRQPSRRAA